MKNMESFKTLETNKEMFKYDITNLTSEHIQEIDLVLAKVADDIKDIRRKTYYKLLNVRKEDGIISEELIHVDLIEEFYKLEPCKLTYKFLSKEESEDKEYYKKIKVKNLKLVFICLVDDETMELIKKVKENK